MMEAQARVMPSLEGGLEPRNSGSLQKLEKARNEFFPKAPEGDHCPTNTLVVAPLDPVWPPESYDVPGCKFMVTFRSRNRKLI
jgi:hypothetical protein